MTITFMSFVVAGNTVTGFVCVSVRVYKTSKLLEIGVIACCVVRLIFRMITDALAVLRRI